MKRFWSKVDQSGGPHACWPWTAYRLSNGYGRFGGMERPRVWLAHRMAYTLANGEIPAGKFVLHACDNKACCNPAHLVVGDHAENMVHCRARLRAAGERNGHAKLSAQQIREMRRMAGVFTQSEIARQFGLHVNYVQVILKRRVWSHIA